MAASYGVPPQGRTYGERQGVGQSYQNVNGSDPNDPPPKRAQFAGNDQAFEQARRAWLSRERGRVAAANPDPSLITNPLDPNKLPGTTYGPGARPPSGPGYGAAPPPDTTQPPPTTTPGGGTTGGGGSTTTGGDVNTGEPVGTANPIPGSGLDSDLRKKILGGYESIYADTQRGADQAYESGAGRLRDRLAQQSQQARDRMTNEMVGRGIGASPALMNQAALGGVNQAESNAYAQGLTDLEQQRSARQENSLNRLNQGMSNLLGLNSQDIDMQQFQQKYGLDKDAAARLWKQLDLDRWKLQTDVGENEKNRQLQLQLARMQKEGGSFDDLMRMIQMGLGG